MAKLQEPRRVCGRLDKDSVKLTPYLGLLERPGGGCYVFNQTYFSPVKIEGEIGKVHEFLKRINDKGVKHLKSDLINLLLQSRILIPKEDKAKPADKWSKSKWGKAWKCEPFTVAFDEKVEPQVLLGNFNTWLEHFENIFCSERVNALTVKNVVLHSPISIILSRFDAIYKALQISKYPFKLNWGIDAPIEWFQNHQGEFKTIESPHVRFSSHLRDELKNEELEAFAMLLNEGFCPHVIIYILDLTIAENIFSQVVQILGKDGFTYEFRVEKDAINALPINEIIDFSHQCYEHKELLLRQSNIYTETLNKIQWHGINNLFFDGESMGRTLNIDKQKYITQIYSLRDSRQSDWIAELKKNVFGECAYSKEKCTFCPVRYFCGGVNKSCMTGSEEEQTCIAEIYCAIKKQLIYILLEDATDRPKVNQKIEFIPAEGTIRIRKAG